VDQLERKEDFAQEAERLEIPDPAQGIEVVVLEVAPVGAPIDAEREQGEEEAGEQR
jgi:hypothetical protein